MATPSIYSTPEGCSWACDFDYNNYLARHALMKAKSAILSPEGYAEFCRFMDSEMKRYFDAEQTS